MAMEDKDRIDILMKEYDSLRQEILSRTNNRFVMLGLVATFLGFALFTENSIFESRFLGLDTRAIVVISGILILMAIWLFFGYLVGALAARVSAIERHVNEIAGEQLLEWETRHGFGRWGRFSGVRKKGA